MSESHPLLDVFKNTSALKPVTMRIPGTLPTGIPELDDKVLGIGGFPFHRITELYGARDTGKTMTCYYACCAAQAQFPNRYIIVIDAENAWDLTLLQRMGFDTDSPYFLYFNDNDLDATGQTIVPLLATGEVLLLIWDSPANADVANALAVETFQKSKKQTKDGKEETRNWRHRKVGDNALAVSILTKAINKQLIHSQTAVVYTNHMKANISMQFGNKITEKKAGSHAYAHNIHIAIKCRKVGLVFAGTKNKSKILAVVLGYSTSSIPDGRNKLAPVYQTSEPHCTIFLDDSYENTTSLYVVDEAIRLGVIKVSGNMHTFSTKKKGQVTQVFKLNGLKKCKATVAEDPKIKAKLLAVVKKAREKVVSE